MLSIINTAQPLLFLEPDFMCVLILFSHLQSTVPNTYHNAGTTCTLPRHPNSNSHQPQLWPTYGGTIAGVRQMSQVQVNGPPSASHQLPQQQQQVFPPPPSTIAMQHLNTRTRICITGVPEAEAAANTPHMVKRESTV